MRRKTVVISAFPCCGKTYAYENCKDYLIIDSDSSDFSWIDKTDKTKGRNPMFPNNYINHIKDNIGKVDIIFVSSHLAIRNALDNAGISYAVVYPKIVMLNEWVGRMYRRGDSSDFIKFIIDNWDEFMHEIVFGNHHHCGVWRLGPNEYIDVDALYNWTTKN